MHRRSVVLSEEQYDVLRASAYLSGQRTGALMRAILDEKIKQLGQREDVQRVVKTQRLERSKLKAV